MKNSIPSNFRPLLRAFYAFPIAIALLWTLPSARAQILFVINQPRGSGPQVSAYNADTGEVINASFITGLRAPKSLALLDKTLFVADESGTVIKDVGVIYSPNFITGLNNPTALAFRSAQ